MLMLNYREIHQYLVCSLISSIMAAIFKTYDITHEEWHFISSAISKRTKFEENCKIWAGLCISDGYGLLRIMFRGKRIKVKVHRMVFFLSNSHELTPQMHMSHLCHNRLCLYLHHLSYEPPRVNNSRLTCKNERECCGHHYANARCLL